MTLYVGPAVGSRGQIGIAEEGAWGKQTQEMTNFIEMTSESIVSEIGSLISDSLRPDRAVHKRIGGIESCGGDVAGEIGPSGFETWFKHALGSVETTRLDTAFIIECGNPNETQCILTITHTNGEATELKIDRAVDPDLTLDLTNTSYDTIGEVMAAINAALNLQCWSPYQALQGTWQSTLHANDYLETSQDSKVLEEITSDVSNIDLMKMFDADDHSMTRRWVVGTEWGVYQHQIDAGATLPEGMSVEVGRDVAAFLYAGMKINTLELNATPGEFFTGTFGLMGKGGTTADTPLAASGNAELQKDAFKVRYTGTSATATLEIDSSSHLVLELDGTSEDLLLNISKPLVDPTTGIVYNVDKVGGLVDYLDSKSYLDCQIAPYTDPKTLCTDLDTYFPGISITSTGYTWFRFDGGRKALLPVIWGDYIGSDSGDSTKFWVKVIAGGLPGTATLQFKIEGGAYGNEATTSAESPTEIRYGSNIDSGYTIFFPDNVALVANDEWSFETIRPASASSYSTIDPFSGYEGALTIDGSAEVIMGWSATINNNLYGDKYHLGDRTRAKLPEQRRTVEGTLSVEFDNLDLYRKFLNGVAGNLVMTFTSSTYINTSVLGNSPSQFSLSVRQPNIQFNGTTPTIADEGIILVDMPYVALYDDVNGVPDIRITIVSDEAYI